MKQRFICWLLKLLGAPQPVLPKLHFYAIVTHGERVADVTTNLHRARAIAREINAKSGFFSSADMNAKVGFLPSATVYRCVPVRVERP